MITIEIRDYYTADLLQQYNKSYIPNTDTNLLKFNNDLYFIVETVLDLDEDEITYYVTLDRVVKKYLSQLTVKHLLV